MRKLLMPVGVRPPGEKGYRRSPHIPNVFMRSVCAPVSGPTSADLRSDFGAAAAS